MEEPNNLLLHHLHPHDDLVLDIQCRNGRCEDDDGIEPYDNSSQRLRLSKFRLRISRSQLGPSDVSNEKKIERKPRYSACSIHLRSNNCGSGNKLGHIELKVLPEYANALVNSW